MQQSIEGKQKLCSDDFGRTYLLHQQWRTAVLDSINKPRYTQFLSHEDNVTINQLIAMLQTKHHWKHILCLLGVCLKFDRAQQTYNQFCLEHIFNIWFALHY